MVYVMALGSMRRKCGNGAQEVFTGGWRNGSGWDAARRDVAGLEGGKWRAALVDPPN